MSFSPGSAERHRHKSRRSSDDGGAVHCRGPLLLWGLGFRVYGVELVLHPKTPQLSLRVLGLGFYGFEFYSWVWYCDLTYGARDYVGDL